MKEQFIIFIAMLTFIPGVVKAQTNSKYSENEKAIRANVAQMEKGWKAKSGAEFAKPFAADADYVIVNGMHIKGRADIAQGHQQIFDTIYKNSTINLAVEQIRFLRPDVAVVHVKGDLKVTEENSTRTSNARITLVIVKNRSSWEIAAFQNTGIEASRLRN